MNKTATGNAEKVGPLLSFVAPSGEREHKVIQLKLKTVYLLLYVVYVCLCAKIKVL